MIEPHHHHPAPPHRHHDVYFNLEESVARAEFARVLRRFADQVEDDGAVRLTDDLAAALPDGVELKVRYERTPHGTLALRAGVEWRDRLDSAPSTGSVAELLR